MFVNDFVYPTMISCPSLFCPISLIDKLWCVRVNTFYQCKYSAGVDNERNMAILHDFHRQGQFFLRVLRPRLPLIKSFHQTWFPLWSIIEIGEEFGRERKRERERIRAWPSDKIWWMLLANSLRDVSVDIIQGLSRDFARLHRVRDNKKVIWEKCDQRFEVAVFVEEEKERKVAGNGVSRRI